MKALCAFCCVGDCQLNCWFCRGTSRGWMSLRDTDFVWATQSTCVTTRTYAVFLIAVRGVFASLRETRPRAGDIALLDVQAISKNNALLKLCTWSRESLVAKVVVKAGRNSGAEFKLNGDHLMIGRRSMCPIPIADNKASREHAVIQRKDGEFYLQDLSRNGTLLNNMPASKSPFTSKLKFGDEIKIGDTVMEVVDEKSEAINIEIPGYQILEKIGQGGMGVVFKAKQLSMDRIVAMKVLNERYSANSEFVDRFIREARAAGKLNHPNVIHVHDISRANGRHYFSMEYIDGMSIKELLRIEKKIDYKKALDIVLQCARALEFAHENQIVHRDVKPDNIMMTKEGIIKIADLGIAKTFEEAAPAAKEHRRVMGTPHYMAPEQALGKPIDHRVDIYSLGATMYHIVTGSTPFNGSTAHEILKAHIQESLQPIQDLNAEVPDPVCFIIERMMAKVPEKRYPSMSKLIEDIERVQKGIAAGIDRIEAGDSTVMRAVKGKKKDGESFATRGPTEEVVTGVQMPIKRLGIALALVVAFALTVGSVVILVKRLAIDENAENGDPKTTNPGKTTDHADNPKGPSDAAKLLQAAIAMETSNVPEYEHQLIEIKRLFAASPEAEEADARLKKLRSARTQEERAKAQAKLDEARAFEQTNPDNTDGILDKYRQVMAMAQGTPDILNIAKTKHDEMRRRQGEVQARQIDDAYRSALNTATDAKKRNDFDTARAALQKFINDNPTAEQKPAAQDALNTVNADAQSKLKALQDSTAAMEIGDAIKKWSEYAASVKDSAAAAEIDAARKALDAKATQIAEDEFKKIAEKARRYDYLEAIKDATNLQRKLRGLPLADIARDREDRARRQKDLYERLLVEVDKELKKGPVDLNFTVDLKRLGSKFKITGMRSEGMFDLLNQEVGTTKHIRELAPLEQYNLHMQFLKKLTADDHKSVSAFCLERDLKVEAQLHDKAAGN
jgi:eukaryotic-like serine/threonine-protein kinase